LLFEWTGHAVAAADRTTIEKVRGALAAVNASGTQTADVQLSGYRYKGVIPGIQGAFVLVLHAPRLSGVVLAAALPTADRPPHTDALLAAALNVGSDFKLIPSLDKLRSALALMVRALDPTCARTSPVCTLVGTARTGPWCSLGRPVSIGGDLLPAESLRDIVNGTQPGVMMAASPDTRPGIGWVRICESVVGNARSPRFLVSARHFVRTRDILQWHWAREQLRAERFEILTHRAAPGSVILLHFAAGSVSCTVSGCLPHLEPQAANLVCADLEHMLKERRIGLDDPGPLNAAGPLVRIPAAQTLAQVKLSLSLLEPAAGGNPDGRGGARRNTRRGDKPVRQLVIHTS
jgi:hypothetical protein